MMELGDIPWRSTICGISRVWTSHLKKVEFGLVTIFYEM